MEFGVVSHLLCFSNLKHPELGSMNCVYRCHLASSDLARLFLETHCYVSSCVLWSLAQKQESGTLGISFLHCSFFQAWCSLRQEWWGMSQLESCLLGAGCIESLRPRRQLAVWENHVNASGIIECCLFIMYSILLGITSLSHRAVSRHVRQLFCLNSGLFLFTVS